MATKAYNPAWARHAAVRKAATRWHKQGFITPAQLAAIEAAHPLGYYRPNIFLRIGLFIFTSLGVMAAAGFVGMISEFNLIGICLVCGVGGLALLEAAIKNPPRHYHSGFDNALLYAVLLSWVTLIGYIYSEVVPSTLTHDFSFTSPVFSLLLLPLLALFGAAVRRYADRLVAALAYLAYLALVANLLLQFSLGRVLLPFAVMLASGAAYLWFRQLNRRADFLYYQPALNVLKTLALVTFYLGGNYLIVREGNAALNNLPESIQIPFAPLFYFSTVAIPLTYVVLGLRRHNRLMLLIGLIVVGFSIYTYRHYRSLLPPEIAATLAGAVLIVFAAWALRYLRTSRHGLTAAADDADKPHFNLESLVVAETAEVAAPEPAGFDFGGGASGGGGATGRF
jgi:hypothetical protein